MEVTICKVHYNEKLAGFLMRNNSGQYLFGYYSEYLKDPEARALSLSLPLSKESFLSDRLFPFFEGLISEGWLKKIQSINQKIDEKDSFILLEENGKDLIGAISITPYKPEDN